MTKFAEINTVGQDVRILYLTKSSLSLSAERLWKISQFLLKLKYACISPHTYYDVFCIEQNGLLTKQYIYIVYFIKVHQC